MKRFYDINGIRICVEDSGETDKKPLLLYHGLTSNKDGMTDVADMFRGEYRTISVDTRGHGESTRPAEYTLEDHARDVHALIEAMGLGKVDILGFSMGSYVALAAAEMDSSDIDHLVLCVTKPRGTTSSVERIIKEKGLDIRAVSQEQMMGIIMGCTFAPATLQKIQKGEFDISFMIKNATFPLSPEEKDAESRSLAGFDNSKGNDKVSCKSIVIAGEFDGINPPALGKEVAEGLGCEFVLIPGAGHTINIEQPELFKKAVLDFLRS